MLADGAGGDAQLVGRVLETHVARGGFEGAQTIQGRKSIGHDRSLSLSFLKIRLGAAADESVILRLKAQNS